MLKMSGLKMLKCQDSCKTHGWIPAMQRIYTAPG